VGSGNNSALTALGLAPRVVERCHAAPLCSWHDDVPVRLFIAFIRSSQNPHAPTRVRVTATGVSLQLTPYHSSHAMQLVQSFQSCNPGISASCARCAFRIYRTKCRSAVARTQLQVGLHCSRPSATGSRRTTAASMPRVLNSPPLVVPTRARATFAPSNTTHATMNPVCRHHQTRTAVAAPVRHRTPQTRPREAASPARHVCKLTTQCTASLLCSPASHST
jgi:hypothetical protein